MIIPALAGQPSWLEHCPQVPKLHVSSPVGAHAGINQWAHKWLEQQVVSLSPFLSVSLKINKKWFSFFRLQSLCIWNNGQYLISSCFPVGFTMSNITFINRKKGTIIAKSWKLVKKIAQILCWERFGLPAGHVKKT